MSYFGQDDMYLKTLTVLYVDDDDDVRRQLDRFMGRRVGALITAGNGAEGLDAFRTHQPHIVITDIKMPVMDGLTMAQEISHM